MWELAQDLGRLIARWWQGDRPRVSPRDGRLLRIQPAAILRIGPYLTEVLRRTAGEDENGPYVIYHCQSGSETCQLYVKPLGPVCHCLLRWTKGEVVQELDQEAIEVFQPGKSAGVE